MLPTDQVEALASLVDEVERVAAVGEGAVRRRREQQARKRGRRGAVHDGGEQGAFGGLAMAYRAPVPEPALKHREIGTAREWGALPSRRLAVAVCRDPPGAVEQREVSLLFRQHGEEVAERGEDGRADSPAVAVLDGEQRRLPQDLPRGHAGRELSPHCLGDYQPEIVGKAVVEPAPPMARGIGLAERGLDPDLSITHLDRT